jgi:hypothetical protein
MRLLISILIVGELIACARHPLGNAFSERTLYSPRPNIAVAMVNTKDGAMSAYVRHSSGELLLHLSSGIPDHEQVTSASDLKHVLTLSSPEDISFGTASYENFERSFDMFQDGRIILVPLPEDDGPALGVFVNLLSGRRYFFAPSVGSAESLAKIRSLINSKHDVTVIVPEDKRAHERVALFPEFRR